MSGILRLSHAEVRVPDLELAVAYYTEVVGLVEVERSDDEHGERSYLKGWDEHQHHSLILSRRPTYGLDAVGFKVEHAADLDTLRRADRSRRHRHHPARAGHPRRRLR